MAGIARKAHPGNYLVKDDDTKVAYITLVSREIINLCRIVDDVMQLCNALYAATRPFDM